LNREHEPVSIGADVDVSRLMEEIREEVLRKRREGIYPAEVAEEVDRVLGGGLSAADTEDLFDRALLDLNRDSMFTPLVSTGSDRPVVGRLITFLKSVIRRAVGWYISGVLDQVRKFASRVIFTFRLLSDRLTRVEQGVSRAEREVDELERRVVELQREIEDLRSREVSGSARSESSTESSSDTRTAR
jgi:hypothetical protein